MNVQNMVSKSDTLASRGCGKHNLGGNKTLYRLSSAVPRTIRCFGSIEEAGLQLQQVIYRKHSNAEPERVTSSLYPVKRYGDIEWW